MPEHIERKAAIKLFQHDADNRCDILAEDVIDRLRELPAADVVEVVHGKWFLLDKCANAGVYCSVCHKKVYKEDYANQKIKSNYCPNCGAKMDLKDET